MFGAPFNGPLVHEVVMAELAARRRGTHATKRAAWSAAAAPSRGARRAPAAPAPARSARRMWTGGGAVFGPQPRHYIVKVNRKARRAALRSALSIHAERGSIFACSTRPASTRRRPSAPPSLIADRRGGSVLVVLGAEEVAAAKSFRNLAGVTCSPPRTAASPTSSAPRSSSSSEAALDALTERATKPGAHGAEEALPDGRHAR